MSIRIVFFLFIGIISHLQAQTPGLPFSKYYSSHDYQGGIQNFAFTQRVTGLLYVANNFGLLEYDGTEWRRYSLPNSTKIRDVAIDKSGLIYVSGQAEFGFFQPDSTGQLQYQTLLNKLPVEKQNLDEVWKILLLQDQVIFCTLDDIFIFNQDLELLDILEADPAFESFHFSNNNLIVNQKDTGLMIHQSGDLSAIRGGEAFGKRSVVGFISLSENSHLVFTQKDGMYELTPTGIKSWPTNLPSGIQINIALRLRNGNIAIGTQRDGIFILDINGHVLLRMNKEKGLRNNSVLSLFEDIIGNLWVGHNNGITLLELSLPFRSIDQFSGLPGTGYDAYLKDKKLYFGTNYGLYSKEESTEEETEINPISKGTGQVYQITQVQDLLLSAQNDGAFMIQNGEIIKIESPSGIWNFHVLEKNPELMISGSYNGLLLFKIEDGRAKFLWKIKGFDESSRLIEQDSNGDFWMAHGYKGVYRLRLNSKMDSVESTYYGIESGLPTTLLNSVWKLNNRVVFSTENGIYQYNEAEDRFEKDPDFQAYFEDDFLATSMTEDPVGNIFYIGIDEVGVLEKQINGTYKKNHQIFNKIRPFLNDDLQNISLIRPNEVLFAANEGFIWYKLDPNYQASTVFPTMIRTVYLTGISDSIIFKGNYWQNGSEKKDQNLEIPYDRAHLRFEASNPIPNNENTTQYQFWLEGFEDSYSEWTTRRDRTYTNLAEGEYRLHVRSKNIYDQIGDVDQFRFIVLPPWYRSNLAYFFYSLLALLFGILLFKIADRRVKKTKARIVEAQSKVIKQKESDLKDSKKEVERLKTEKLKSEIQNKNKELASATMHLINKNGFIVQTKSHLNSIIKKSKNQEVKNEIKKIISSIEKNIAGDKDWEQFEMHFDEVHGDFMSRFKSRFPDLSPQEIKLSAYLRMNLSSKEIANLMNITIRGVEIARYRLRKKIQLERSENLQEFILKF